LTVHVHSNFAVFKCFFAAHCNCIVNSLQFRFRYDDFVWNACHFAASNKFMHKYHCCFDFCFDFCYLFSNLRCIYVHHWTQKKESSIQTVIWLTNRRANLHEKNKSSIEFRTAQKTAYWRKNRNRTLLRSKIAQKTTLFQRSTAFLIKSLSVSPFLDA